MRINVGVVSYGMGNLKSVANALEWVGGQVTVCEKPSQISDVDKIVLPGVGAFGDAIGELRRQGWSDALDEEVKRKGKPFLGICLGLQLLADTSTEHGTHRGLGWIRGSVERLNVDEQSLRVPHIGWNDVQVCRSDGLFADLGKQETFYFVHSYVLRCEDETIVSGVCTHGSEFVASVEFDNICATQFHPEKSHKGGLKLLENFIRS